MPTLISSGYGHSSRLLHSSLSRPLLPWPSLDFQPILALPNTVLLIAMASLLASSLHFHQPAKLPTWASSTIFSSCTSSAYHSFVFLSSEPQIGHLSQLPPFTLKIRCLPFPRISIGRKRLLKAARRKNLRHIILNAAAYPAKDVAAGSEQAVEQYEPSEGLLDVDRVLLVGEGVCIVASSAACLASMTNRRSQESRLVASSTPETTVRPRFHNYPAWQTFPLLAAILINAILRARYWQGTGGQTRNRTDKISGVEFTLEERVRKLEEEVASAVTVIRVLSKQLEKLGVRFRVTRQTLRDPIQETALLADKTSQAVNVLAAREDALEKGLEEIQEVLVGMQGNQVKQLELISALGKLVMDRTGNRVGGRRDNKKTAVKQDEVGKKMIADGALRKRLFDKLGDLIPKNNNSQLQEDQLTAQEKRDSFPRFDHSSSQRSILQGPELKGHTSPQQSYSGKDQKYGDDHNLPLKVSNLVRNHPDKADFWHNDSTSPSTGFKLQEPNVTGESAKFE